MGIGSDRGSNEDEEGDAANEGGDGDDADDGDDEGGSPVPPFPPPLSSGEFTYLYAHANTNIMPSTWDSLHQQISIHCKAECNAKQGGLQCKANSIC
jgi:hypothetical protein